MPSPLIESLWTWFAAAGHRYHWVAAPFGLALLFATVRVRSVPRWLFLVLLAAAFVAYRWFWAVNGVQLSSDESQLLASARTLMDDPVFWRSVDLHTAGPLDAYPLTLLGWLGLPLRYATARVLAFALDWVSVVALYTLVRAVGGEAIARAAALVPVAFFCLNPHWELSFYGTEAVPAALVSVGLCALWLGVDRGRAGLVFGGALALGGVPWAKLQAGPIAVVAGLGGMIFLWRRWRAEARTRRRLAVAALAGGASVSLLLAVLLTVHGLWAECYASYFQSAADYVAVAGSARTQVLLLLVTEPGLGFWALAGPALVTVGLLLGTAIFHARENRLLLVTLGGMTLAAAVAVSVPGRLFPHYLHLLVLPLAGFAGVVLAVFLQPGVAGAGLAGRTWLRGAALAAFLAVHLLPQVWFAASSLSEPLPFASGSWRLVIHPVSAHLREVARPGDALAMWGWEPMVYVQTGLVQGTREAHTQRLIEPGPQRDRYRRRYLADLALRQPRFFVDAVGPGRHGYQDPALHGHETWPELAAYLAAHYRPAGSGGGMRVYERVGATSSIR